MSCAPACVQVDRWRLFDVNKRFNLEAQQLQTTSRPGSVQLLQHYLQCCGELASSIAAVVLQLGGRKNAAGLLFGQASGASCLQMTQILFIEADFAGRRGIIIGSAGLEQLLGHAIESECLTNLWISSTSAGLISTTSFLGHASVNNELWACYLTL